MPCLSWGRQKRKCEGESNKRTETWNNLELHKLTLPHLIESRERTFMWCVASVPALWGQFVFPRISLYGRGHIQWPLELIFFDEEPEVCRSTHAQSTWVSLSLCEVEEKTWGCILSVSVVDCHGLVLSAKPEEPTGVKERKRD